MELVREAAALRIQRVYRGYRARRATQVGISGCQYVYQANVFHQVALDLLVTKERERVQKKGDVLAAWNARIEALRLEMLADPDPNFTSSFLEEESRRASGGQEHNAGAAAASVVDTLKSSSTDRAASSHRSNSCDMLGIQDDASVNTGDDDGDSTDEPVGPTGVSPDQMLGHDVDVALNLPSQPNQAYVGSAPGSAHPDEVHIGSNNVADRTQPEADVRPKSVSDCDQSEEVHLGSSQEAHVVRSSVDSKTQLHDVHPHRVEDEAQQEKDLAGAHPHNSGRFSPIVKDDDDHAGTFWRVLGSRWLIALAFIDVSIGANTPMSLQVCLWWLSQFCCPGNVEAGTVSLQEQVDLYRQRCAKLEEKLELPAEDIGDITPQVDSCGAVRAPHTTAHVQCSRVLRSGFHRSPCFCLMRMVMKRRVLKVSWSSSVNGIHTWKKSTGVSARRSDHHRGRLPESGGLSPRVRRLLLGANALIAVVDTWVGRLYVFAHDHRGVRALPTDQQVHVAQHGRDQPARAFAKLVDIDLEE